MQNLCRFAHSGGLTYFAGLCWVQQTSADPVDSCMGSSRKGLVRSLQDLDKDGNDCLHAAFGMQGEPFSVAWA